MYLKEIGVVPLLSNEEEQGLAILVEQGRLEVSSVWLRPTFVWLFHCKRYVGRGMQFLDLIPEEHGADEGR